MLRYFRRLLAPLQSAPGSEKKITGQVGTEEGEESDETSRQATARAVNDPNSPKTAQTAPFARQKSTKRDSQDVVFSPDGRQSGAGPRVRVQDPVYVRKKPQKTDPGCPGM